jgi:hypothetical protein
MDKRYQVFISSTYSDLIDERQQVIQTLLKMNCIPTGMELFPAADEEQFTFIKKVIDDCDYYLLIIGGRYGSMTADGISFTEKEYDYAVERGIPIIALIHGNPEIIPAGKTELNAEARQKLDAFREKVSGVRLIDRWARAEDLPAKVALSLLSAFKSHPAVGWVRADSVANIDLLQQVNQLQQENTKLLGDLSACRGKNILDTACLAQGDQTIKLSGKYKIKGFRTEHTWEYELSWNFIISLIGPHLLMWLNEAYVNTLLTKGILKLNSIETENIDSCQTTDELFQIVKIQFMALGWIEIRQSTTYMNTQALFWILTEQGKAELLKTASLKAISQQ